MSGSRPPPVIPPEYHSAVRIDTVDITRPLLAVAALCVVLAFLFRRSLPAWARWVLLALGAILTAGAFLL